MTLLPTTQSLPIYSSPFCRVFPYHLILPYISERQTDRDRSPISTLHRHKDYPRHTHSLNGSVSHHICSQDTHLSKTMSYRPSAHGVNITTRIELQNNQGTTRTTTSHHVQATTPVPDPAHRSRGVWSLRMDDFEISVDISRYINPAVTTTRTTQYTTPAIDTARIAEEVANFQFSSSWSRHNVGLNHVVMPPRPSLHQHAAGLLGFLPQVSLDTLPHDSKTCPVCAEDFPGLDEKDTPIRLRCNHVIGRECMRKWILGGNSSCPICRAEVFEPAREQCRH